jgi:ATP-dependent helicase HrpB
MADVFPIDRHLPVIVDSLKSCSGLIVKAEPGAGKTTRLPPALLKTIDGIIYVLEPRRLAARLSAERVASEMGEEVGQTVGYMIRHDRKVSDKTRLIFLTEGLFLRLLRSNPELDGVGCVVLDEFHERSIHVDLALAFCKKIQLKKTEMKLVVMSATLDSKALESYLPDAAVFDIAGRVFPVKVEYRAMPERGHLISHLATCVKELLKDKRCPGNILVFLTGIRDIMDLHSHLKSLEPEVDVIPLSADVAARDQKRAFALTKKKKIILATNVAETSLTLPGVTGVVDGGLAKIAAYAPWSGMPTLDIKRISKASCIQRSGRAGRIAPGIVYRAYSEADYLGREAYSLPDIRRLDLTQSMLEILDLAKVLKFDDDGGDPITVLPWLEVPEEKSIETSLRSLNYIRAVDKVGVLTEIGRDLVKIPLHPRLAAIVCYAKENGFAADGLLAAAIISEGRVLGRNRAFEKGPCDLCFQIDAFKRIHHGIGFDSDDWETRERSIDQRAVGRVLKLFNSLASSVGASKKVPKEEIDTDKIIKAVLHGYPDRVARHRDIKRTGRGSKKKARPGPALYNFCLGRGGVLAESSVLKEPEFLIAVEATEQLSASNAAKGTMIHVGSSVTPAQLGCDPAGFIKKTLESEFVDSKGTAEIREVVSYGSVIISERVIEGDASTPEERLREIMLQNWPRPFESSEPLDVYHRKIKLLDAAKYELDFPVFEGEMFELLIASICDGKKRLSEISEKTLGEYLNEQLNYEQQQALARLPSRFKMKNGKEVPVSYLDDSDPLLIGYIQDFYGLDEDILLCEHRIKTVVEIIGPNRRPVQKTNSIQGFWSGAYREMVPAFLRRYPRHHWAEDPTTAPPLLLKKHLK